MVGVEDHVQFRRGEIAAIRFPASGNHAGNAGRASPPFSRDAGRDDTPADVVDNQTATWRAYFDKVAECGVDGIAGQVRRDTEPHDKAWLSGIETAVDKSFAKHVMLEIAGYPSNFTITKSWQQAFDDWPLAGLGGGYVHLEDPHWGGGTTQTSGVEAGAKQHKLIDASTQSGLACIVGITHPQHDVGVQSAPQAVDEPKRGIGRTRVGQHGAQHRVLDEMSGVGVRNQAPVRRPHCFGGTLGRVQLGGQTRLPVKPPMGHSNHLVTFGLGITAPSTLREVLVHP